MPKRQDLVRNKERPEQVDRALNTIQSNFYCALSKQPLHPPIVACQLGKLYNKDAVYEFLIDSTSHGNGDRVCPHIKKPRDVTTLNLTDNPSSTSSLSDYSHALFICPVTMREMNGNYPFCYLYTCGCVFSRDALKQVPSDTCLTCGKAFTQDDIIPLNPTSDQIVALSERMEARQVKKTLKADDKSKKASKKRKATNDNDEQEKDRASKKPSINMPAQSVLTANATTSSAVPKVLKAKETSDVIKSLYTSSQSVDDKNKKKGNWLTRGTFNRYVA